jgi:Fe-S-cluster containining protein
MIDSYKNDVKWSESNRKRIDLIVDKARKDKRIDDKINNLHDKVFEVVDCLKCANCCKTTGPLLTSMDIGKLSRRLKIAEKDFFNRYLRVDEDGDFVFQSMPCPFLGSDNYCSVYEDRPKACRAFPHTDQKGQMDIMHLTRKNAKICPAVSQIFQQLVKL